MYYNLSRLFGHQTLQQIIHVGFGVDILEQKQHLCLHLAEDIWFLVGNDQRVELVVDREALLRGLDPTAVQFRDRDDLVVLLVRGAHDYGALFGIGGYAVCVQGVGHVADAPLDVLLGDPLGQQWRGVALPQGEISDGQGVGFLARSWWLVARPVQLTRLIAQLDFPLRLAHDLIALRFPGPPLHDSRVHVVLLGHLPAVREFVEHLAGAATYHGVLLRRLQVV